jgi:hypothetical protein
MALYVWKCQTCGDTTRKILSTRPMLGRCDRTSGGCCYDCDPPCGGKLSFVTNTSQSTKEVIDNGLMYKPIERDPNIEAQLKERNELAEKGDDTKIV